ncbi:MAG: hypothetical protein C3F11_07965 [Methylocystaceae bacterium]|nr:MAG: hypothetical protein C3F11_07965 [Methylocystaceae bacterium]
MTDADTWPETEARVIAESVHQAPHRRLVAPIIVPNGVSSRQRRVSFEIDAEALAVTLATRSIPLADRARCAAGSILTF